MESHLQSVLLAADRDTQLLFYWTELWSEFHFYGHDLSEAFDSLDISDVQRLRNGVIDRFTFCGWRIDWTGWKRLTNSDYLVCQWLAYDPAWYQWHLYSSWPGACGPYAPGMVFDISMKPGQEPIITRSAEWQKLDAKLHCLWTLLMMIRDVGNPPYSPPGWRSTA